MASFRVACPYCERSERMQFHGPYRMWNLKGELIREGAFATTMVGAAVCPSCNRPIGLHLEANANSLLQNAVSATSPEETDARVGSVRLKTVPAGNPIEVDEALPERIRRPFADIQEDARRSRNPTGIMSVARGCLDVALKDLGEASGGRRERIARLAERRLITTSIASWSQTLWEEGSDAAHDLEADIERAIEHVEFLKLFFEVVYGLPSKIAAVAHAETAGGAPAGPHEG